MHYKINSIKSKIAICLTACVLLMPFSGCGNNSSSAKNTKVSSSDKNAKSGTSADTSTNSKTSYATALKYAIDFYDANKCGKDVKAGNVFDWRGPCFLDDGKDVGHDLSGGYNDAGDCVKFGLPQGYSASVLGWSLYTYKDAFDNSGNTKKMLEQLKYFTDYFLKCHTDANTFYYQIGDGDADHAIWCPPEQQTLVRKTVLKADASHPASDVLGETSAALSLMYLNYKSTDAAYADKCLKYAKELYSMGKTHQGLSSTPNFYKSSSYGDDMSWAAIWLCKATGDKGYITDAQNFLNNIKNTSGDNPYQKKWTMCWDDMFVPCELCLYDLTNDKKYQDGVEYNLNYWETQIATTPGGLKYLNNWGSARYAASASMIALIEYGKTKNEAHLKLAKSQIDYILGDNPAKMSYMIGFGDKWCEHVHHRAANGYTFANNDWTKPAQHLLLGGLVGGPDQNDSFNDDINQYQFTEVALDYNAGLVGALAGMSQIYKGKGPNVTVSGASSSSVSSSGTASSNAAVKGKIEVQMFNANTASSSNTIYPKFKLINNGSSAVSLSSLTLRYYFTKDGTQQQSFWCDWATAGNSNITGKFTDAKGKNTDCCLVIGFASGAGSLQPGQATEVQTRFAKNNWSNYNQSNDYSFNSGTQAYSDWSRVTLSSGGKVIWGAAP